MNMVKRVAAAAAIGVGLGMTGLGAAAASPVSASATPQPTIMVAASSYAFNCSIPRIGSNQCGNVVTVPAKQTLYVDLISSGGKSVTFLATDSVTGDQLGTGKELTPGSVRTKIISAGNRAKSVRVLADASGWTTVTAKGRYTVS